MRSASSERFGVVVVGLGPMGRFHAENVRRIPGLELVGVVDADEEIASAGGLTWGVAYSTSLEAVLTRSDVDAVVLASPTQTHPPLIERAAGAGKHVFCEKPIALDLALAEAAVGAARSNDVVFHVGLHRRFDPDWQACQQHVASGALGRVRMLRMVQRAMAEPATSAHLERNGNIFIDTTLHDLDAATWLVGEEPEQVTAFGGSAESPDAHCFDHADTVLVVLRFPRNALAVIDNTFVASYGYDCSAEVMCERGALLVGSDRRADGIELLAGGRAEQRLVTAHTKDHPAAYVRELEHFEASMRGDGPRESAVSEVLAAFRLAERASESYREGHSVTLGTGSSSTSSCP